ncbi:MAG: cytochrome c3 family protein [Chloroflexi bacterium]|nr:cytochrome c3 family protein [Chloroflexota bacterium]
MPPRTMENVLAKLKAFARAVHHLPRGVKVGILAVLVVVAASAIYGMTQVYSYTQDDPTFCRSCHTMTAAWDRWQTSEHRTIGCHKCHEQSVAASMEQVVKYTINRPNDVSKHADVPSEVCKKCHESGDPQWKQVADTAGHKVHVGEKNLECTQCHAKTVHRFVPPSTICGTCHVGRVVQIQEMNEMHCLECHNFLRPDSKVYNENSPLMPSRQTCLQCHQKQTQSKVTFPDNAPMQFQCGDCHKPHEQAKPIVDCQSCHADLGGKHTVGAHSQTSCATCHKPHEWTVDSRDTCQACHKDRVDHNPGQFCGTCHSFKKA